MNPIRILALAGLLTAGSALAQQPAVKTTEQQARSYIASAFITGAAPLILSDDVALQPELRAKLALPADANSRTVYQALMGLTGGKPVQVRPAIRDEILKSQVLAAPGRPVFALEAGATTLVLQYDLERDNVAFVGQPSAIAVAAPVAAPEAPQRIAQPEAPAAAPAQPETPATAAVQPVPTPEPAPVAPVVATPEPAPAPDPTPLAAVPAAAPAPAPVAAPTAATETHKPGLQMAEPEPAKAAAVPVAKGSVAPAPVASAFRASEVRPPLPKPNGPCAIKPVMSDQDLVNCGATPHY